MAPFFPLEAELSERLANVSHARQTVALIGLDVADPFILDRCLCLNSAPEHALEGLRQAPAAGVAAGEIRRPLQLAVWGAAEPAAGDDEPAPHAQRAASALLAWLRDVGADETWVLVKGPSVYWPRRLPALGFAEVSTHESPDGASYRRFSIAIRNYKPTPDWFGPRNWANPELFGVFRW